MILPFWGGHSTKTEVKVRNMPWIRRRKSDVFTTNSGPNFVETSFTVHHPKSRAMKTILIPLNSPFFPFLKALQAWHKRGVEADLIF